MSGPPTTAWATTAWPIPAHAIHTSIGVLRAGPTRTRHSDAPNTRMELRHDDGAAAQRAGAEVGVGLRSVGEGVGRALGAHDAARREVQELHELGDAAPVG